MKRIEGILPALVTPYASDGSINEQSLRKLIDRNLEKGVDGFYVGGSTAEAFLLSHAERRRVVEVVSEHLNGRGWLVVHVGSIRTDTAIDLARHAQAHRADAVSAIPPFYYRFTMDEVKRYYFDIADAVDVPLILYNFPAFSGVNLDHTVAADLFDHKQVTGIKHTSLDLHQLERMKHSSPEMSIFNGHDEVFLPALAAGADGAIGSTYNFMAEKFVAIRARFAAGDVHAAQELQTEANSVIDVLKEVGVFNGIKYILALQGIETGQCRSPFLPLTESQRARIRDSEDVQRLLP